MVRDLNISREIEKFSFIRTIHSHHNNDVLKDISPINEVDLEDTEDRDVSALCRTSSQSHTSSLAINQTATISDRWYSLDTIANSNLSTVVVLPESELHHKSDRKKGFNYYLDRILLILASGYLCFVFWWLFGTKNAIFSLPFFLRQETISQADVEFIDYMKQSLEIIDRKVATKKTSTLQTNSSKSKTPEVVYVPVFTPTPQTKSNEQFNLLQPNKFLPPPPPPNQLAAINQPVSAIPIESPAPPSESVKVKTTPTIPKQETATATTPSQKLISSEKAVVNTKKTLINHTLVGVMELKEGSAALFKVNGITQRIWLGDKIENTGWVLDSVANQKVQISSQGKTLTLSVGENFN